MKKIYTLSLIFLVALVLASPIWGEEKDKSDYFAIYAGDQVREYLELTEKGKGKNRKILFNRYILPQKGEEKGAALRESYLCQEKSYRPVKIVQEFAGMGMVSKTVYHFEWSEKDSSTGKVKGKMTIPGMVDRKFSGSVPADLLVFPLVLKFVESLPFQKSKASYTLFFPSMDLGGKLATNLIYKGKEKVSLEGKKRELEHFLFKSKKGDKLGIWLDENHQVIRFSMEGLVGLRKKETGEVKKAMEKLKQALAKKPSSPKKTKSEFRPPPLSPPRSLYTYKRKGHLYGYLLVERKKSEIKSAPRKYVITTLHGGKGGVLWKSIIYCKDDPYLTPVKIYHRGEEQKPGYGNLYLFDWKKDSKEGILRSFFWDKKSGLSDSKMKVKQGVIINPLYAELVRGMPFDKDFQHSAKMLALGIPRGEKRKNGYFPWKFKYQYQGMVALDKGQKKVHSFRVPVAIFPLKFYLNSRGELLKWTKGDMVYEAVKITKEHDEFYEEAEKKYKVKEMLKRLKKLEKE